MKQLLLRVPEALHQRLTARAAREGRSVNALATEMLDAVADADLGNRRARLRARVAAAGLQRVTATPQVSTATRRRALAATEGIGPVLDRLLGEERNRV